MRSVVHATSCNRGWGMMGYSTGGVPREVLHFFQTKCQKCQTIPFMFLSVSASLEDFTRWSRRTTTSARCLFCQSTTEERHLGTSPLTSLQASTSLLATSITTSLQQSKPFKNDLQQKQIRSNGHIHGSIGHGIQCPSLHSHTCDTNYHTFYCCTLHTDPCTER